MGGVFSDAMDDIFNNDDVATPASYTFASGGVVPVSVLSRKPETLAESYGHSGFKLSAGGHLAALVVEVRVSEVAAPAPAQGDTMTLNGRTYPVRDWDLDAAGLTWTLTLGKPS